MILVRGTNINALYPEEKVYDLLRDQYPEIAGALLDKSYVIPGMIQTQTLSAETGEVGSSTTMVPQGIALADKYLVISAYSKDHLYNSVLYILDRNSGLYLKTIVLPGTPHAGGVAWDEDHNLLWITEKGSGDLAAAAAITLETIEADDFAGTGKAVVYDYEAPLNGVADAATINYHDHTLYIGTFSRAGDGRMLIYPVDENGHLAQGSTEGGNALPAFDLIQGIEMNEDLIFLSQSWGRDDSSLRCCLNNMPLGEGLTTRAYTSIKFPPYMEQIAVDGNEMYVLFESVASEYRQRSGIVHIDRVLVFDLPTLTR